MPLDKDEIEYFERGSWPANWKGAPSTRGLRERMKVALGLAVGCALIALLIGWPVYNFF